MIFSSLGPLFEDLESVLRIYLNLRCPAFRIVRIRIMQSVPKRAFFHESYGVASLFSFTVRPEKIHVKARHEYL